MNTLVLLLPQILPYRNTHNQQRDSQLGSQLARWGAPGEELDQPLYHIIIQKAGLVGLSEYAAGGRKGRL